MPDCEECKELAPEWELLANNLQDEIKVGKVDCSTEIEISSRFDLLDYPTIILYRAEYDDEVDYDG